METHGSESYFVIGEGLLSESIGGRDSADVNRNPSANTSATIASAKATAAAVPPFRFSRMGPNGAGKQVSEAVALKVGREMAAGGGGSGPIPAGFTYLGQFIDHDLTFDKTNVMLGEHVDTSVAAAPDHAHCEVAHGFEQLRADGFEVIRHDGR